MQAMKLHHRAIVRGYRYSPSSKLNFMCALEDIGFAFGTKWKSEPRVTEAVERLRRTCVKVTVEVRDAS